MNIRSVNAETGKTIEHEILEISPEIAETKTKVGEASGIHLSHCVYLAARHASCDILEIMYYRPLLPEEYDAEKMPGTVHVAFYRD